MTEDELTMHAPWLSRVHSHASRTITH